MRSRFKKFFKWLNLLLIVATLLAILAPYASPKYSWWVSLFGMSFPWLFFANFCFVLFWLITKNIYFLFSAVCILLSWNAFTGIFGFNGKDAAPATSLNVMSFNCRAFYDFTADKPTKTKILQLLQSEALDVICFQEFPTNPNTKASLIEQIKTQTQLPYYYQPEAYALAIFSKYPLHNSNILKTDNVPNGCIYADIHLPKGQMRVYNVHLKSNHVSDDANKVLEDPDLQKKSTWLGIKTMLSKIRTSSKIRTEQAQRISKHIEQCRLPVVLCGDLNETPQSYVYNLLTTKLHDSFRLKGAGRGSTYAGKIPVLRIDYILAGEEFRISDHRILRKDVSDHYPVVSSLHLK
jgi:endonuclease/exonuclease/phosphatase family metal-dependent hydrolase